MSKSVFLSKTALVLIFGTLAITSLVLSAQNTKPKCHWAYKNIDISGSEGCDTDFSERTCSAAFVSTRATKMSWNNESLDAEEVRVCPWRSATLVLDYAFIALSALFVIVILLTNKHGYVLTTGSLAFAVGLLSVALMGGDLKFGSDRIGDLKTAYNQYGFTYEQSRFVLNFIFNILVYLIVVGLTVKSYRAYFKGDDLRGRQSQYEPTPVKTVNTMSDVGSVTNV